MSYGEQLCGCFTDMYSCLISAFIPFGACILHSMAVSQLTNRTFLTSCVYSLGCCFGMSANRQKIKKTLRIDEKYWMDCFLYFLCGGCAASQDFREAENRYLINP